MQEHSVHPLERHSALCIIDWYIYNQANRIFLQY